MMFPIAKTLILLVFLLPADAAEPPTYLGKTVNEWIAVLRDKSSRQRGRAIDALGAFGQAAKAAVPDLIEISRNQREGQLQIAAAMTLSRIGPAEATPAVPLLVARFIDQGCLHLTGAGTIGYTTSW